MDETEIRRAQEFILRELIKKRKIGGAHTPLDNITKNLPDEFLHQRQAAKVIERAVKELVNSGMAIILQKRTGKGSDEHISINPRAWKEIGAFLNLPPGQHEMV